MLATADNRFRISTHPWSITTAKSIHTDLSMDFPYPIAITKNAVASGIQGLGQTRCKGLGCANNHNNGIPNPPPLPGSLIINPDGSTRLTTDTSSNGRGWRNKHRHTYNSLNASPINGAQSPNIGAGVQYVQVGANSNTPTSPTNYDGNSTSWGYGRGWRNTWNSINANPANSVTPSQAQASNVGAGATNPLTDTTGELTSTAPNTLSSSSGVTSTDTLSNVLNWVYANPLLAGVLGFGAFWVLTKKR